MLYLVQITIWLAKADPEDCEDEQAESLWNVVLGPKNSENFVHRDSTKQWNIITIKKRSRAYWSLLEK